jgi:hypothetical protein
MQCQVWKESAHTGQEDESKRAKEELSSSPSVCGGHKNDGAIYYRPLRQKQSVLYSIDKIRCSLAAAATSPYQYHHQRSIGPCVPSFLAAFAYFAVVRLHQDSRLFPWPNLPKCIRVAAVAAATLRHQTFA